MAWVAIVRLLAIGFALPVYGRSLLSDSPSDLCDKPAVRKEWRSLSVTERKSYLSAVKCIIGNPSQTSRTDLPGARNRYEDFLGVHIVQADSIHFTGRFYPFHRLMLYLYEAELQACGYHGAHPYWDWTIDAVSPASFARSALFDPDTGFGGNGAWIPGNISDPAPGMDVFSQHDLPDRTGGGCIPDGPFRGLVTNLGPLANVTYNPRCVRRDFAPSTLANMSSAARVAEAMRSSDYAGFDHSSEYSIHPGGHLGVGGMYGSITDKWASPADPIFYLHHANIDRAWWSWQMRNISARTLDIAGPSLARDWDNTEGGNVTLDEGLHLELGETVSMPIRDVMHIQRGFLCYSYDTLY